MAHRPSKFFALTALQDVSLVKTLGVSIFEESDVEAAFTVTSERLAELAGDGSQPLPSLAELLTALYRGEYPEAEYRHFEASMIAAGGTVDEVSLSSFLEAFRHMEAVAEASSHDLHVREYTSSKKMREDRYKHRRCKLEVRDKFTSPPIASMEVHTPARPTPLRVPDTAH